MPEGSAPLTRVARTAAVLAVLASGGRALRAEDWQQLEARGAVIREVRIEVVDVFDRRNPDEDTRLGRLADALHVSTRPEVVRGYLLFKEGDRIQARRVEETERALRSLVYLKEADVQAEPLEDGAVRMVVHVRDAWSWLIFGSMTRQGGQNRVNATVLDWNVLGRGKFLSYSVAHDAERSSQMVNWYDPHVLGSRYELGAGYDHHSDGQTRMLNFGLPFYSLDTPWAAGVRMVDDERDHDVYDRNVLTGYAHARVRTVEAWSEWSLGMADHRVTRLGLWARMDQTRVTALAGDPTYGGALPEAEDRRVQSVSLRWSLAEDHYATRHNFAAVGRREDLSTGWTASIAAGWSGPGLGATRSAPVYSIQAGRGWDLGPDAYLSWNAGFQGRREDHAWKQALAWTTVTGYKRFQYWQVLAGRVSFAAQRAPDLPTALYLGGDDGSRGYRNHLYAGDERWVAVAEDRFITDRTLLRVMNLGFVVYADAASVRRLTDRQWTPVLASVGGGVRLGDLKSAFGTVYNITVAFPLTRDPVNDRFQVLLSGSVGF